jgi:hypothetical protein
VTVTRPFKISELVVPSPIAPYFNMTGARINGRDQLAGSNPVPLMAFSEAAVRPHIRWETVNPSAPLVLTIAQTDTVSRTFRCAFFGVAVMK